MSGLYAQENEGIFRCVAMFFFLGYTRFCLDKMLHLLLSRDDDCSRRLISK